MLMHLTELTSICSIYGYDGYERIPEKYQIEIVYEAIHKGKPTKDLLAIKYFEALAKISDGNATKVFLPIETSGVLRSIAGIAELFKDKKNTSVEGK